MEHQPPDAPGDYNQALMELGALVCVPNGAPLCENARSPTCAPPVLRALHWSCPAKQRPSPADCSL